MKKLLPILIVCVIQGLSFSQSKNYLDTIWSEGISRTFRVYVPAIYDSERPTPLVFNFHGMNGTASSFENFTKFRSVADTANFLLVTPNGRKNPHFPSDIQQTWNNFDCCPNNADDAVFVSNMIDTLAQKYNIDLTRVYSAGYSNGGFMGYDLACRLSNRIAAIASVAGSAEYSRLSSCNPTRAVPVLEIHGTNDPIVPYTGGELLGVSFHSVNNLIKFWVEKNLCSVNPSITILPNTNTTDGSTVERHVYSDSPDGNTVELLKIINGGHTWPGAYGGDTNRDIIADNEIWRFFLKHKLAILNETVERQHALQIIISPNPASDFMKFTLSGDENAPFSGYYIIADAFGRMVKKVSFNGEEYGRPMSVDLTSFPVGMYFLVVEDENNRTFNRFTVVR